MKNLFIILHTSILLTLGACTKSCQKNTTDTDKPITLAVSLPIETLDPRFATSAIASRISNLVYGTLFILGEDLTPKPFLAESIESIDEKSFKLLLKPNLKFHNNSPLTAQDVVYTFSELGSEDVLSPHAEKFNYVEKISATDERTVIFELKEPFAPFLTELCGLGIVSEKQCKGRSKECRHENMGSGPYQVQEWDTAKEALLLKPFAQWFEGASKHKLLFRVVRDENTRMLELINGKTDIVEDDISPQNAAELQKEKNLQTKKVPGLGYSYLAFNVRGPLKTDQANSPEYKTRQALANQKVRMAIAHAIDFDQIIEKILLGNAKRVSGLIPNGHWAKDANLSLPSHNPDLAKKLLDEAGFKENKQSKRFNLVIATTPNRTRQSIAMLYADFLQRVGINASVRVKDWSALYQDMKQGQFEMFSAVWVPVTDPDLYYWVHHSANIPTGDKVGGNRHGYVNKNIDRLIELARKNMVQEQRKTIYQEIEKIMIEELPYIPLWNENRIVVMNKRIKEYSPMSTGSLMELRKINLTNAPINKAGN